MDLMQNLSVVYLTNLGGALAFSVTGYLISRLMSRNDVADVLWGLGFLLIGYLHLLQSEQVGFRSLLVFAFVGIWSLRLALYLGIRTSKKSEDARYASGRRDWGAKEPLFAFLKVFLLQGAIMSVIALPIGWALRSHQTEIGHFDLLAAMIFIVGIVIETAADGEMATFKKDSSNKGKILTQGVWAFCRHPNYFGEILIWWALAIFCLSLPDGWVTLISPVTMTYLLMKVSGVPMLENLLQKKGAAFAEYARSTRSLLPFSANAAGRFFFIMVILVFLDFLWLQILMGRFYQMEIGHLGRMTSDGRWDPIMSAAFGVYFFLALGIYFFAIESNRARAWFKGAILGLCIYAVYDLTNLSLVKDWSWKVSLVDIAWGTFLCSSAAWIGSSFYRTPEAHPFS